MNQLDEATLTKLKFAVSQQIPPDWTFEVGFSPYLEMMVWQLKSFLLSREIGHEQTSHPADWWQAFKERWFPHWALKRWPVVYTCYDIKVYHTYPGLTIQGEKPVLRAHVIPLGDKTEPLNPLDRLDENGYD